MDRFFVQRFFRKRAAALVSVLIFIILTSMIALSSIFLMTNQARIAEKQIRRIRAFYSSQAATVQALDELYQGAGAVTSPLNINNQTVNITYNSASLPFSGEVNATANFTF